MRDDTRGAMPAYPKPLLAFARHRVSGTGEAVPQRQRQALCH